MTSCFPCRHPLYPLLALLFEKCELATQSAECPTSDSFNVDIQAFVQHQQQEKRPLLAESEETNELVSIIALSGLLFLFNCNTLLNIRNVLE